MTIVTGPGSLRRSQPVLVHEPPALLWSITQFRRSLVPMVIVDDERRYVGANAAACLLLRRPETEIVKLRIEDLTPPENRSQVKPLWKSFLRDGTQKGAYELLMPDGPRTPVEYSATANVEPGRHVAVWMLPSGSDELEVSGCTLEKALLTSREREILGMIAMGMDSGWMAAALGLSHATVQTHVRHCLQKLGARNRAHAIALGLAAGEISLDLGSNL